MTKSVGTFLFFLFFNTMFCVAQDTIVRMNGKKIICKVIEITEDKIIYSVDIKTRIIDQIVVSHVKYQDGTIDFFRSTSQEKTHEVDIKRSKNNLFKSGLSFSLQPGYSYFRKFNSKYMSPSSVKFHVVGLSVKLENRWFYGQNSKFRNGLQLTWLETAGYISDKNFTVYLGLINPGYCGIYKVSEKSGLEYSLNFGFGILGDVKAYTGINLTPKLEYTIKNTSFGISYSTFLFGRQIEIVILGNVPYRNAISHTFNLSYRFKF